MRRTPYGEFAAFTAVAELRSFTQAAKQIGISTAHLSQTIRMLEERLGVRLLNRTTRSVAPTAAGESLLTRLRPLLDGYEAVIESINQFRDKPAGTIRLTVAPPAVESVIRPRLGEFCALYPDIHLAISIDGEPVDIIANQFDAGIRRQHSIDRDMIAVRVSDQAPIVLVGSPAYLARHGKPVAPLDLQRHNCLRFSLASGATVPWRFTKAGKSLNVSVTGSLVVNDVALLMAAAADGAGLVYGPREYAVLYLADGRLVSVLEDWVPAGGSFYLYYSSRRQNPAALQALIDFLRVDKKTVATAGKKARRPSSTIKAF
jgi:DNA-binding transcriptional LysR family regulator